MTDPPPTSGAAGGDDPDDTGRYLGSLEPDPEAAHYDLLEIIADLEGCDTEDLPPLYERVDNLVEQLFKTTPVEKAQAQVEFTYYDYRVKIDQSGHVALRKQLEQLNVD